MVTLERTVARFSELAVLNQAAVVVSHSKQSQTADKFLDFVRSSCAVSLMECYGFSMPAVRPSGGSRTK